MSTWIQSRQNVRFGRFIESVIILSYLSLGIWHISCVRVAVTVQCSKTISNHSNLLCPVQPRKPNYKCKRPANKQCRPISVRWPQRLGSLWQYHDIIVPWWTKLLLASDQIRQYRADYARCVMGLLKALAKMSYWGRDRKFKRLSTVMITVPWLLHEIVWYFIYLQTNKLVLFATDSITCRNCTFSYFDDSGSRSTSEKWMVARWFGALNRDFWTELCDISQI